MRTVKIPPGCICIHRYVCKWVCKHHAWMHMYAIIIRSISISISVSISISISIVSLPISSLSLSICIYIVIYVRWNSLLIKTIQGLAQGDVQMHRRSTKNTKGYASSQVRGVSLHPSRISAVTNQLIVPRCSKQVRVTRQWPGVWFPQVWWPIPWAIG